MRTIILLPASVFASLAAASMAEAAYRAPAEGSPKPAMTGPSPVLGMMQHWRVFLAAMLHNAVAAGHFHS